MKRIKIAAVSVTSTPGNKAANLDAIEAWTRRAVEAGAQLICFPEMAVTGYWRTSAVSREAEILKVDTDNPALIHPAGPSVERLAALSKKMKCHLLAGIIEDLDYYHLRSSVALFGPTGFAGTAALIHTPIDRHPTLVAGRELNVMAVNGVKVGVMVGEDVFYPEIARCLVLQGAQVLVGAMATPVAGGRVPLKQWRAQMQSVLATRALENQVAVIAVEAAGTVYNRIEDARMHFVGQALAFDASGRLVGQTPPNRDEKMLVAEFDIGVESSERIARRRPFVYQSLMETDRPKQVPGTRQQDWDAQGEILWSRLRDLGFFCIDLYDGSSKDWKRRHEAVIVTAPTLPPLKGYRVVVLTRPSLAGMPEGEAAKLAAWVKAGGRLVLDGYCGRNQRVLGPLVGIEGPLGRAVHLPSYEDPSRIAPRIRVTNRSRIFAGMEPKRRSKVWGQVWFPEEGTRVTARPLAWIDSPQGEKIGPGIYHHEVGRGEVYTWAFSSAYSQLLLMQGRGTTEDLGSFPARVAPGATRDGDVNTWGDQVVTDEEDQYFPSADYLLYPLLGILRQSVPDHMLISAVPEGRECGVIFTGDSDRASVELVNRYTDMLSAHGIRPTQFICREGYEAKQLRGQCEYGIHPLFHETEQACFENLLSYGFAPDQLVCGRRHCLIHYGLTETLERMAKAGIRYTSNNWDFPYPETQSAAFLFGTTHAHHIYNWEGKRIGIVNIPQVFMDYPPVMECTQASWRDTRRTHGVGAWNYHPQNHVMPFWCEAIEWLAQQAQEAAWCGTMGEYGDWYLLRDRMHVSYRAGQVTIDGSLPKGLTFLSRRNTLFVNGVRSRASATAVWHGVKYWVHVHDERTSIPSGRDGPANME